ncbi:hypothetical protein LINGRAHAP2_LOCUS19226 [Linum grandiflorum]
MHPPRALLRYISTINSKPLSSSRCHLVPQLHLRRTISTTTPRSSWMDSIKGVFTGKKTEDEDGKPMETAASFTLSRFADELKKAQKVGSFKQYLVGRSSEATFSDAFSKMEAVIRYLSTFDDAGEVC